MGTCELVQLAGWELPTGMFPLYRQSVPFELGAMLAT